jgi:glycine/serine hydroxymethyltransferase
MAMVKVWNDNIYPHVEKFKGKEVHIPSKEFIEMDYDDAKQFQGQYKAPVISGQGHDPRGFKKIRVENPPKAAPNPLMNHANGAVAPNEEALKESMKEYAHMAVREEKVAENKLRKANEEHAAVMGEVKTFMNDMRSELDAKNKELEDLKNVMGSAPFNLSKDEVNSLQNNNKGGGKNANRGNNSKG